MPVMRLGYVHVRVTDLDAAINHYSNTLGMKIMHQEGTFNNLGIPHKGLIKFRTG